MGVGVGRKNNLHTQTNQLHIKFFLSFIFIVAQIHSGGLP